MKNKFFRNLFALMFIVTSGLLLTACGAQEFDATKIKLGSDTFTYDGYSHVREIDYEVEDVTVSVTYSTTADGEFKPATELTFVNAGTYNVYYKISAEGYNDYISSEPVQFKINPKTVSVSVNDVNMHYSEINGTTPAINPAYTTNGVVVGDNLGLSFAILIVGLSIKRIQKANSSIAGGT